MPRHAAVVPLAIALSACWVPLAQTQTAPAAESDARGDGRFVFHEVEEGILRLDTRIGELSLCGRHSAGWTCRIVPDERSALDAELSRLHQENAALRAAIAAQSGGDQSKAGPSAGPSAEPSAIAPAQPPAAPAPPDKATAEPLLKLPTSDDLARAGTVVVTAWRRLVEMMVHLREDLKEKR